MRLTVRAEEALTAMVAATEEGRPKDAEKFFAELERLNAQREALTANGS